MQRVLRSGFGRSWIGSRVASAMRWGGAGFKAGQVRVTGSTMASHSCSAGLKGWAQCAPRVADIARDEGASCYLHGQVDPPPAALCGLSTIQGAGFTSGHCTAPLKCSYAIS